MDRADRSTERWGCGVFADASSEPGRLSHQFAYPACPSVTNSIADSMTAGAVIALRWPHP